MPTVFVRRVSLVCQWNSSQRGLRITVNIWDTVSRKKKWFISRSEKLFEGLSTTNKTPLTCVVLKWWYTSWENKNETHLLSEISLKRTNIVSKLGEETFQQMFGSVLRYFRLYLFSTNPVKRAKGTICLSFSWCFLTSLCCLCESASRPRVSS